MKPLHLRISDETEPLLEHFLKLCSEHPEAFKFQQPQNKNAAVNQLLHDYLVILFTIWERQPNKKYQTIFNNLASSKGNSYLDEIKKQNELLLDRINQIYYLNLYASNNLIIGFDDYLKDKGRSIYDQKSEVFDINLKLKNFVDRDNKKILGRSQKNRKKVSENYGKNS